MSAGTRLVFRYIALLWNPGEPALAGAASRLEHRLQQNSQTWTHVLGLKGLSVFVTGTHHGASGVYPLAHARGDGVVLGTLFSRRATREGRFGLTLHDVDREAIARSQGHELIDSYWGRYVAVLVDAQTGTKRVLRDPTGGMPCWWVDAGGVQICCSWLEDCLWLDPRPLSLNWDIITTRLAVALFHSEHTGLNEVSEVRAGECVCLSNTAPHHGSDQRSFYWSPVEVANRARLEDPSLATAELRRTADMCVQAWASRYDSIIHYLSGGLDSAIVLAGLTGAQLRTPVVALNYFLAGADSDERVYARAAALRAGCELVERERNDAVDLRRMLDVHRTANPVSTYVRLEAGRHEAELAARTGAQGIFSGDGGDALFFRTPAAATAIDYVRDHGPVPRSLEIALNAAFQDDVSVWTVLRNMWRYGVRCNNFRSVMGERSHWGAVSAGVIASALARGDFVHPWFESGAVLPPGKQRQAFLLSFAPDFYDPFDNDSLPEKVAPLLSQPLIELCLQIPTYVLAPGPQDRMLARNAFASGLPELIRCRVTKGSLGRHVKCVLEANREFLADLLLDGVLVSRQLLDRRKLEEAVSGVPAPGRYFAPELFEYAGIESWVRAWMGSGATSRVSMGG